MMASFAAIMAEHCMYASAFSEAKRGIVHQSKVLFEVCKL